MIKKNTYLGIVFFVIVLILALVVREGGELYAVRCFFYCGGVFVLASILEGYVVQKDETKFETPFAILAIGHIIGICSCCLLWLIFGGWGPPYPLAFIVLTYVGSALVYLFVYGAQFSSD